MLHFVNWGSLSLPDPVAWRDRFLGRCNWLVQPSSNAIMQWSWRQTKIDGYASLLTYLFTILCSRIDSLLFLILCTKKGQNHNKTNFICINFHIVFFDLSCWVFFFFLLLRSASGWSSSSRGQRRSSRGRTWTRRSLDGGKGIKKLEVTQEREKAVNINYFFHARLP